MIFMGINLLLSFVMPTRNRGDKLRPVLNAAAEVFGKMPDIEFIVVDNGSADVTAKIVGDLIQNFRNFSYIYEPVPGLLAGRHAGWNAARGDVIVFLDDDVIVSKNIVAAYCETFSQPDVGLAGGNCFALFESAPPTWLSLLWELNANGQRFLPELSILEFPDKNPICHDPYLVWGCNFAVRKTVLEEAEGFHPDGYPFDLIRFRGDGETHVATIAKRNRWKTIFHPDASVHHMVSTDRMTLDYIKKRAFSEGVSNSYSELRRKYLHKHDNEKRIAKYFIHSLSKFEHKQTKVKPDFFLEQEQNFGDFQSFVAFWKSKGREYHQAAFNTDKRLREWVLQKNYLTSSIPEL
ncbi:glycosyltransferase [Agrobacterium larrymoorei]|uniref:glycosyltransferase n=1 Tax=Agrobacterium larrymoorei TaxID=160699 RepID=UPI0030BBC489